MSEYLLDTNYILRFLLNDIPSQVKIIKDKFLLAKEGKINITVPYIVFLELDFALSKIYQFSKDKIVDKLLSIIASPYLDIEKRNILLQALSFFSKTNISFVDSVLLVEARQTGKQLLTFDKKLKKLV